MIPRIRSLRWTALAAIVAVLSLEIVLTAAAAGRSSRSPATSPSSIAAAAHTGGDGAGVVGISARAWGRNGGHGWRTRPRPLRATILLQMPQARPGPIIAGVRWDVRLRGARRATPTDSYRPRQPARPRPAPSATASPVATPEPSAIPTAPPTVVSTASPPLAPSPPSQPAASPTPSGGGRAASHLTWVMDWSTARSIADNPAAEQAIAGATIYEIVSYGGTVAPGLPAIPTLDFKSVSTMAQAFSAGDINSWDRAVVYDPEHWSQTPLAEQQSVVAATAEAAQLAAAHHLTFIATPATDLMEALTPGQWPLAQDYLSYNLAGKIAAAGPQLLGVQAQAQEENPSAYGALTAGGAAQVRDANASVAVIGDLTDHIGSTPVPVASVVAAAGAVDQVVDGFFLNAPTEGGAIIQALG